MWWYVFLVMVSVGLWFLVRNILTRKSEGSQYYSEGNQKTKIRHEVSQKRFTTTTTENGFPFSHTHSHTSHIQAGI